MSRMIWIGMGLALAALSAGCADVEPTDVDDVEANEQIDHVSSALLQAPVDDGAVDRGIVDSSDGDRTNDLGPAPSFEGQTAPQAPGGEGMLKMDPEPSPWNQKRNDT